MSLETFNADIFAQFEFIFLSNVEMKSWVFVTYICILTQEKALSKSIINITKYDNKINTQLINMKYVKESCLSFT